jgi:tRNA A37 threonylcarbamoyladenosine dehydratase
MEDQRFSRIRLMVGDEGVARLERSHVAVCGLGAVGSYAVEGLARAGVGRLRLVDFDEIRQSNINRQLYALTSTVGRKKVDVARERILDINPRCQVEAVDAFVHRDTLDRLLAGPPELVVDAIDSMTPKLELLAAVAARGIPVISCLGAALRTDPARVRVGPMAETRWCPLAYHLRRRLRARGVPLDFTCVYSVEPVPRQAMRPADDSEPEPLVRGRKRLTLGSLPTLTGIFGLTAANEALRVLVGDRFPRAR